MSEDVVLVTGAARGIGRAVSEALASAVEAPSALVLADLDRSEVQRVAEGLAMRFPAVAVEGIGLDVADPVQVSTAFETIESRHGPISRLAHAAGVLTVGAAVDTTVAEWDRVLEVNARGTFLVTTHAARHLLRSSRPDRALVVVASNAAGVPRASMGAYAASKAASVAFTRCLGLELAPLGIRCNSVCPGSTDTQMQRSFWGEAPDEGRIAVLEGDAATFRVGIPLGRIAEASDIADAVVFLLSPSARHITMQDLYVDGGATLRS